MIIKLIFLIDYNFYFYINKNKDKEYILFDYYKNKSFFTILSLKKFKELCNEYTHSMYLATLRLKNN